MAQACRCRRYRPHPGSARLLYCNRLFPFFVIVFWRGSVPVSLGSHLGDVLPRFLGNYGATKNRKINRKPAAPSPRERFLMVLLILLAVIVAAVLVWDVSEAFHETTPTRE